MTLEASSNIARQIWAASVPVDRTLGARFLRARGLSETLPDVRFHPACPRVGAPLLHRLPALLIAGRRTESVEALERIFLHPDTAEPLHRDSIGHTDFAVWRGGRAERTIGMAATFDDAAAFMAADGRPCWAPIPPNSRTRVRFPSSVFEVVVVARSGPETPDIDADDLAKSFRNMALLVRIVRVAPFSARSESLHCRSPLRSSGQPPGEGCIEP